jgi:hypothetical protein
MSFDPSDIDYCGECEHAIDPADGIDWTGRCPYCGSLLREPENGYVVMMTNAPACYDYGNTVEAGVFSRERVRGGCNDTPMREIWIRDTRSAQIQKDRNLSGLYVTLTLEEYRQWHADGFFCTREGAR